MAEGVTAGVFFGTAAVFIRYLQVLDSFSIVFWRLVIACVALVAVLVVCRQVFQFRLVRENLKELLVLGVFLGLHFVFFTFSVLDTTILNATVLVSTAPIFSMFVSTLVFRVKPSRFALVGLVVSFIGVCVIALGEATVVRTSGQSVSPTLKGDLEGVAAGALEAFYLNYGGRVRKEMGLLSAMLPIYFFSAVIVAVLSVPAGSLISPFPLVAETALLLVGLGLVPTAIAHTLYFSSLSHLKSFETASLALLEPVGATLLGIAIFREVPAPVFAFGAAMVLAGIFFVIQNSRR
ncbi:MAG TPA: DMT family transporter [Candidatus Acidoferrales bacterium]|nr:DMT family transporter [Candidatus Acidoferrales bacterium]